MNRLEQVRRLDAIGGGEVGDGARDFQDAIVGSRGKVELFHRLLKQIAERRVDRAMFADLRVGHPRVGSDLGARKARMLARAGGLRAFALQCRGLTGFFGAQFGQRKRGCLDMKIDPVEQRAADAGTVALNLRRRAAALVFGIAKVTAGTGMWTQRVRYP